MEQKRGHCRGLCRVAGKGKGKHCPTTVRMVSLETSQPLSRGPGKVGGAGTKAQVGPQQGLEQEQHGDGGHSSRGLAVRIDFIQGLLERWTHYIRMSVSARSLVTCMQAV